MARRVFTKLRRFTEVGPAAGPLATFLRSTSTVVLVLFGLVLLGALVMIPPIWAYEHVMDQGKPWLDAQWGLADRIERDWQTLPLPPPFLRGDEPAVATYLDAHPLLYSLKDRTNHRIWVRDGSRLVPLESRPEPRPLATWYQMAEQAPTFQWFPPRELNPEHQVHPVTLLTMDRWMAVKRWELGSEGVERHLRRLFPADNPVRVGVIPQTLPPSAKAESWGAWPHAQLDPYRAKNPPSLYLSLTTNAYGEGWSLAIWPSLPMSRAATAQYRRLLTFAYGLSTLVLVATGYGIWIRARARRRAALESDRLASLTHSLKTPLAILKFRCDSLRLGRLGPDQADEQLLRLGAEVDHLTLVIDNGLRAIKGDETAGPASEANPDFFREVAADLEPAFEAEERRLDLLLCEDSGRASLQALRSAVATLLENALAHGAGTVTLQTQRLRRALLITVRDEGPGLSSEELEALGRPFQRFRAATSEGFRREGLGLGLSLLIQMAEREGWGLQFTSDDQGLLVELKIRLHGRRTLWEGFPLRRTPAIPLESK